MNKKYSKFLSLDDIYQLLNKLDKDDIFVFYRFMKYDSMYTLRYNIYTTNKSKNIETEYKYKVAYPLIFDK